MPRVSEAAPARFGYGTELVRPRDGITLILGDQQTGKSYLFKRLIFANLLPPELLRAGWHRPTVVWDPRRRFIPRPGLLVNRAQDPEEWARACFALAPCVAAADEADEAFPSEDGGVKKGTALNELMRYARNPRFEHPFYRAGAVPVIAVARRPFDLCKKLRSSVNVLFLSRISDKDDRECLRESMGVPREIADQLATLPDRRFLRVDRGD
jgi:hypothetical protein